MRNWGQTSLEICRGPQCRRSSNLGTSLRQGQKEPDKRVPPSVSKGIASSGRQHSSSRKMRLRHMGKCIHLETPGSTKDIRDNDS